MISKLLWTILILKAVADGVLLESEQQAMLQFRNYFPALGRNYNETNVNDLCGVWTSMIRVECVTLSNGSESISSLFIELPDEDNVMPPDEEKFFDAFTSLESLTISHFTHPRGQFPSSLFKHPALKKLVLRFGTLVGTLPDIDESSQLQDIFLAEHPITGTIPASWALRNWSSLLMDFNSLSCPIPEGLIAAANSTRCALMGMPADDKGRPCGQDNLFGSGCNFLPLIVPSYDDSTPLVTTEGEKIYVEVFGRRANIYGLTRSGEVFRDEHFIFELQGYNEFKSNKDPQYYTEELAHDFEHVTKDDNGVVTLTGPAYNGAQLKVEVTPSTSSVKFSLGLKNVTFKNAGSPTIGIAIQITYKAQFASEKGNWNFFCNELNCVGEDLSTAALFVNDGFGISILTRNAQGYYTFANKYTYGPNNLTGTLDITQARPMFLPYGNIWWIRAQNGTLPPSNAADQRLSLSLWLYINLHGTNEFWYDPDFSLTVLLDTTTPSSSPEYAQSSRLGVALGVTIPVVLVVATLVVVFAVPPVRKRIFTFANRKNAVLEVKTVQTSDDANESKRWTQSNKPLSIDNVK